MGVFGIQAPVTWLLVSYYEGMMDGLPYAETTNRAIRWIFDVFDWLVTALTWLTGGAWAGGKGALPPIRSQLLHHSARKLAVMIRNREVSCQEVIETYINRIKDIEPHINSVVEDRFVEAAKEARAVDEFLHTKYLTGGLEEDKPLLGVPFTVKETIGVKGLSNNAARSRVTSRRAADDADVVRNLRDAGAIPLLVSNTPELCLYWETYNKKFGRTNNPYDTRRTVGGSSGGEVALISAAGSVVGLGSDIAGSLRFPAFFCGVYGHKPTPGFVSNSGHIPTSDDPMWNHYFSLGPLTRYAEDLPVMLKCMTGEKKAAPLGLDEEINVSSLKIYYMYGEGPESLLQKVPGVEVIRAMSLAISTLRDTYSCQVQEVRLKELVDTLYLNAQIVHMKGIENIFQPDDENPDNWGLMKMFGALLKKLTFRSSASISCVLFGPLKYVVEKTPENLRKAMAEKTKLIQDKVLELLKEDGVLIYPTFPQEAPLHNRMCSKILDVSYCTIFNLLGLPVTQCPVTTTKDGLPIGVQIASGPKNDKLCMAVARAIELELGGWVSPSPTVIPPKKIVNS